MSATSALNAIRARTPMIQFRHIKGAIESMISSQSPKLTQSVPPPKPSASLSNTEIPPARFRRKLIESDEMEYIQRGGPE